MATAINNTSVYNYYVSTYGSASSTNRYDSHKNSELRDVYNRMIRANKDAPLYKIDYTPNIAEFAIDLKESARSLSNVVAAMTSGGSGIESLINKKVASSSNEDAVEVEYVGDDSDDSGDDSDDGTSDASTLEKEEKADKKEAAGFQIGIKSLAKPQVNQGRYLVSDEHSFEEGSYGFDLDTNSGSYEFQFNVSARDTNKDVQEKIKRLINTSDVGLTAEVDVNRKLSSLKISSKQTGLASNEKYLFNITSGSSWNEINLLGINEITSPAESSTFTLNGKEHHSLSNNFTINHEFEVTLKDTTAEGDDAHIGFKANTEAIADSVNELVNSYNGMIAVGQKYSENGGTNLLYNEVSAIGRTLSPELSSAGITVDDDGMMTLDKEQLSSAVSGSNSNQAFHSLNMLKDALQSEAKRTSVNPMKYVNKVIVEYKNPHHTFSAPYAVSAYSGILVDTQL